MEVETYTVKVANASYKHSNQAQHNYLLHDIKRLRLSTSPLKKTNMKTGQLEQNGRKSASRLVVRLTSRGGRISSITYLIYQPYLVVCIRDFSFWIRRNNWIFRNYTQPLRSILDIVELVLLQQSGSDLILPPGGSDGEKNTTVTAIDRNMGKCDSVRLGILEGSEGVEGSDEGNTYSSRNSGGEFFAHRARIKHITVEGDGSWRYSARLAGGGALILDQFGNVRCAKARNFNWGNRAKEIEALALEMGIDMAIEAGIKHITVEGDAEILLKQVAGTSDDNFSDRTIVKDIVARIRDKSAFFSSIYWHWIPRNSNRRAHKLDEIGISLVDSQFWDADFPLWLLPSSDDFSLAEA